MQIIAVYRYEREDGKITISLIKPDGKEYTEKYRLVADEGKVLTNNGEIVGEVCGTDSTDGWGETDSPEESTEET